VVQIDQENDNNEEEPSESVKVRLAGGHSSNKYSRGHKGMAGEKKEGI
jgi:hypothetical protein